MKINEKIIYGYDEGGQVVSVTGNKFGHDFNYVKDIGYDEYGQRVYIEYGNGVKTDYTYDSERRWLSNIRTENSFGAQFQNIDYSFDRVGNVLEYRNDCLTDVNGNYNTAQRYSYDSLYQLIRVDGETIYNPYKSVSPEYKSVYSQEFTFDEYGLGNMTSKISSEKVSPQKSIGDNLNYKFNYAYDENYAHRLVNVGNRYYKYDSNGNIICEQDGSFEEDTELLSYVINEEGDGVYSSDYAWGYYKDSTGTKLNRYKRTYAWNERNLLISSVDDSYNTAYVYGQDGQRSNKYTASSETVYFNKMWTYHNDSGNSRYGGQYAKNVYLGDTRIVTKLNSVNDPTYQEEYYKQYYYHSDHLGSASLISDYKGEEYQRIEYTPYGETWVEKTSNTGNEFLPYKFTGKEMDEETGLYYYGARYLDPKYSVWISTDPALGDYIPAAGKGTAKDYADLPGMGGIFNPINGNLYHYAGNNPVKYTDPDGRESIKTDPDYILNKRPEVPYKQTSPELSFIRNMYESGCNFMSELFGVQKDTGVNFSALEIYSLVVYLQAKDNPSPNAAEGEKCLTEDFNLRNPDELINKAYEIAGANKKGRVNWGNKEGQKPAWIIIKGKTALNNDHYQYANNEGRIEYEPYKTEIQLKYKEKLNVYIFDGEKE